MGRIAIWGVIGMLALFGFGLLLAMLFNCAMQFVTRYEVRRYLYCSLKQFVEALEA